MQFLVIKNKMSLECRCIEFDLLRMMRAKELINSIETSGTLDMRNQDNRMTFHLRQSQRG